MNINDIVGLILIIVLIYLIYLCLKPDLVEGLYDTGLIIERTDICFTGQYPNTECTEGGDIPDGCCICPTGKVIPTNDNELILYRDPEKTGQDSSTIIYRDYEETDCEWAKCKSYICESL